MSEEKMREEFEIAAKTAQGLDVTRLPHGGYRSFATHQAWWAWQASRANDRLAGKMARLVAAGNRLNAEAEECIYGDGIAEVASSEYWCEFRDALEAATEVLAAHRKQGGGK